MMKKYNESISRLLEELTSELKSMKLWQEQPPSAVKLASSAPFCCDTLAFEQWLQFIFIAKITELINLDQALPSKINLTPMAEESFRHLSTGVKSLLAVIKEIDEALSRQ